MKSSLYIDHQLIAPLISKLEKTVQLCNKQLDGQCTFASDVDENHELRMPIYEQFMRLLQQAYLNRAHEVKIENEDGIKFEINEAHMLMKIKNMELSEGTSEQDVKMEDSEFPASKIQKHRKINKRQGRPSKNQQAEIKLAEWVAFSGRVFFGKKQIDEYFQELNKPNKPTAMPIKKMINLFKKYKLFNITIQTRNGELHLIEADHKNSEEDLEKKQEIIPDNGSSNDSDLEVKKQEESYDLKSINTDPEEKRASPWQQMLDEYSHQTSTSKQCEAPFNELCEESYSRSTKSNGKNTGRISEIVFEDQPSSKEILN